MTWNARRASRCAACAGALLLGWPVLSPGNQSAAAGTGPAFANSAVNGGGFISVLARATDGTLVAGGDTQGFFRSLDSGETWTPQDAGIPTEGYHVAGLLPEDGIWYAAVGDGTAGGVAESLDDGVTWIESAHGPSGSPPYFDGDNLPGKTGHPRATGDLLASDGSYLYAASFGSGLERWPLTASNLGTGWQCIALCTSFLNSLALDANGDAFVSVISSAGTSEGVDEVTGIASGSEQTTGLSTSKKFTNGVQELLILGARLYVAGTNGIGYWSAGKWYELDPSSHWYTLTGYEVTAGSSPVDVLYAATYAGKGTNDVEQLTVTGTTAAITGLVPRGSVSTTIEGTSSTWWEATSAGTAGVNLGPDSMIGGCPSSTSPLCSGSTLDGYAGSSILPVTHDGGSDELLVGGRSGIWYDDPSPTPEWQPAVEGLDTTFDYAVAVDPADGANVAASDDDWNVLASTDDMHDVDSAVTPPFFVAGTGTGLAVTWDTSVTPSALIASGGNDAQNTQGSIWYDSTWASGGPWTSLPLPTGVSTRPIALAAEALSPGVYVLVAAFEKSGVYAFTASGTSGTWALVASPAHGPTVSPNNSHGVSLAWASDGSAVFMYDTGTHAAWKAAFNGTTFARWIKLYADTGPTPGPGYVASDPSTPTTVWISNENGLGRIDTTSCTTLCTPTWVTSTHGGPLATYTSAGGDYVYMASGGVTPSFWEVQVTECPGSCPNATGFVDPYYDEVAGNPIALAAGADGGIYVATEGNGIAVAAGP